MNRSTILLLSLGFLPLRPGLAADANHPGPMHQRLPVAIAAERDRLARQAAEIDRDGDGYITVEERRAWRDAKRAERAGVGAKVRVEDWVKHRLARLEALDTNKDGRIEAEEWRQHHRGKGHGRFHAHGKGRAKGEARD